MPAKTPAEVHELFAKHFTAGDLNELLSLYEPGALLLQQTGHSARGATAISEALKSFLSLKGEMSLQIRRAIQAGDLALVMSNWTLRRRGPNGEPVETAGQTADVMRRQADGTWLLVIDVPHGADVDQTRMNEESRLAESS